MAFDDDVFLEALHRLCSRDGIRIGRLAGTITMISVSRDCAEYDLDRGLVTVEFSLVHPKVHGKSRSYDAESTAEDMPVELPGAPKQLPPKVAS